MSRHVLAIFAVFLVATFATTTGLVLDVEVGSQGRQIAQLRSQVTRIERAMRPHPRLTADIQPCPLRTPAGTTCITGKLLVQDPGSDTPHQLLIEDKNGAPMFWVDYGGAGSGGEPFCVYGLDLTPRGCLGGPQGSYGSQPVVTLYAHGHAYSLTARDITWIHAHGG